MLASILSATILADILLVSVRGESIPAPAPVRWSSYDKTNSLIMIEWDAVENANYYELQYTDPNGLIAGPYTVYAPSVDSSVDCAGANDGRNMDIQLRVTTNTPETSAWSIAVTLICADMPVSPDTPTLIMGTADLIQVEWTFPTDDGGSAVLGYYLFMRTQAEADAGTDYTLVYDGGEDPTLT